MWPLPKKKKSIEETLLAALRRQEDDLDYARRRVSDLLVANNRELVKVRKLKQMVRDLGGDPDGV